MGTKAAEPISKISVIMMDAGFRERFHLIDCLNNQTLPRDRYEIIWVEHFDKIHPELQAKENVRFILLNRALETYSMSHCLNEGVRQSTGDLLVIPDGDVFIRNDFLERVLTEHERYEDLVLYIRRYDQAEEDVGPMTVDYLERTCHLKRATNYGGCVTVRKKWMLKVNGYEQHPIFYGHNYWGGRDLYVRFRNLGLAIKWHPSLKVYHPWHPNPKLERMNREEVAAQRECIRRRELSLMYLPYQGLNPELDSEPDWLPAWREQWRKGERRRRFLRLARKLIKGPASTLISRG